MKKKILSILLVAVMVVSLLPTVAFAANKGEGTGLGAGNAWDISASDGTSAVYAWLTTEDSGNTYTLHIAGSGAMKDWGLSDSTDWHGNNNEYKTKITAVDIGSGVTSIGNNAFNGCSGLTSVAIPSSVTSIGNTAFQQCSGLTSVTIPSSVTSIGNNAFAKCTSVADLYIDSIESWFGITFTLANNVPFGASTASTRTLHVKNEGSYNAPEELVISKDISSYAFYNCSSLKRVTIQSGVTSIGHHAFCKCENLESVTIPSNMQTIERSAFQSCKKLTSVTIPKSVTSIGDLAFGDTGLTSVTFEENSKLGSIGGNVFMNCTGLTSVTIPSSVTSIGNLAFNGCSTLKTVNVKATNPPTLGTNLFGESPDSVPTIYVPYGKGGEYKEATNWSTYKDNIKEAYMVDVATATNGTVTVDKDWFPSDTFNSLQDADKTVNVSVTPDEGYALKSLKYNDGSNDYDITDAGSGYQFTMPAANVTVTATFEYIKQDQDAPENGEGYTVDRENGKIIPSEGYEIRAEIGNFNTKTLPLHYGVPYFVRKAGTDKLNPSQETEVIIPEIICEYDETVKLSEDTFGMKLNYKDTKQQFTFTKNGTGWNIQNSENKYLAMKDGKLALSTKPFAWTYKSGAFSTSVKTTQKNSGHWLGLIYIPGIGTKTVTTTYYLSTVTGNAKLSTCLVSAELYKTVTADAHDYKYVNKGNGTHDKICKNCGESTNEACVYDQEGNKCICGAYDPSKTDVKISVTGVKEKTTKQYVGFFPFGYYKNVKTYTATIKTEATGVKVTKVQYQLNGGKWMTGTNISSDKPIKTLNIKVLDNNGKLYEYTYNKGN